MNRIAKALAPAALVLAAFGAQAGELTPGDINLRAVQTGSSAAVSSVERAPVVRSGEILPGDVGATSVAASRTINETSRPMVRSGRFDVPNIYIGA